MKRCEQRIQADTAIAGFKLRCDSLKMDKDVQVLPHGSYLINVANPGAVQEVQLIRLLLLHVVEDAQGGSVMSKSSLVYQPAASETAS